MHVRVSDVVSKSDSNNYLTAGMGSGMGFVVVLCSICFFKRRKKGTQSSDQSRCVYFI